MQFVDGVADICAIAMHCCRDAYYDINNPRINTA